MRKNFYLIFLLLRLKQAKALVYVRSMISSLCLVSVKSNLDLQQGQGEGGREGWKLELRLQRVLKLAPSV